MSVINISHELLEPVVTIDLEFEIVSINLATVLDPKDPVVFAINLELEIEAIDLDPLVAAMPVVLAINFALEAVTNFLERMVAAISLELVVDKVFIITINLD